MSIAYTRVGWEDAPSTQTPIDASNLNHMDNGILALSDNYDQDIPDHEQRITDLENGFDALAPARMETILGDFATVETDPDGRASKTYNVGARFVFNDYLYKATTTINQYDIITDSVNCEKVTVDSEFAVAQANIATLQDQMTALAASMFKVLHLRDYVTLTGKDWVDQWSDYTGFSFVEDNETTGEYFNVFYKAFTIIFTFEQESGNAYFATTTITKTPETLVRYGDTEAPLFVDGLKRCSTGSHSQGYGWMTRTDGAYFYFGIYNTYATNKKTAYFNFIYHLDETFYSYQSVRVSLTAFYKDVNT